MCTLVRIIGDRYRANKMSVCILAPRIYLITYFANLKMRCLRRNYYYGGHMTPDIHKPNETAQARVWSVLFTEFLRDDHAL